MRKFGKLQDGTYLCQLSEDEVKQLRHREGVRKNRARRTALLGTIMNHIEQTYDLPGGSIRVINPETGKPYRRDARIGTIRENAE